MSLFMKQKETHRLREQTCQGTNCDQHSGSSKDQMPKEESPAKETLNRNRIWVGRSDEVAERKAVSP